MALTRTPPRLKASRDNHEWTDGHFAPMTEHCGLDNGVKYDFILKVEEVDVWYADLVRLLDLEDSVEKG